MKRIGYLFEKVADFHALCAAAKRAARGKARTKSATHFLFYLESEVLSLQREILDGSYRPRNYRTFYISDPKPRTISAADFRDRALTPTETAQVMPDETAQELEAGFTSRLMMRRPSRLMRSGRRYV